MNVKKALFAIGFILGLLITFHEGKYFPFVNFGGLLLFGISAIKLNVLSKRRE